MWLFDVRGGITAGFHDRVDGRGRHDGLGSGRQPKPIPVEDDVVSDDIAQAPVKAALVGGGP
jgi:hypothetical protein